MAEALKTFKEGDDILARIEKNVTECLASLK